MRSLARAAPYLEFGHSWMATDLGSRAQEVTHPIRSVKRCCSQEVLLVGGFVIIGFRCASALCMCSQEALYSGYYAAHCFNYHALTAPDGIIVHMFGPGAGRGTDINTLNDSKLLAMIAERPGNSRSSDAHAMLDDLSAALCLSTIQCT